MWDGESPTTPFEKNSCVVCFDASMLYNTHFGFLKDHGTLWAKRLCDKVVNILMFSQESLEICPW